MEARTRKSVILCILTIAVPLFSGLGLALIFALCHFHDNEVYLSFTGVAATICLFASLSIVAVELVAHLFNKQASWNTLLAAFGLFIMFVIAPDATNLYRFDPSTAPENMGLVFETASHLGGIIAMIGLFRFLKNDYHIHFEKREVALSYTLPILGAAVLFAFALLQIE